MLLSKNRIIRRRAVVGLLLAASLTLLTLSFRQGSEGVVGAIQRDALSVTAPFATVAHRVTRPGVDAWNWVSGLASARDSTEKLKQLEAQIGQYQVRSQADQEELARLRAIANFRKATLQQYPSVSGPVIEQSPSVYQNTVTIGIGSDQGVSANDPVVAPTEDSGALIGKVVQVAPEQAQVQLLIDPDSYVTAGVQGERNAVGVIASASGQTGVLSLELIPNAVHVSEGDTVVTQGFQTKGQGGGPDLTSQFPPGIPIGRVTQVSSNDTVSDNKVIQVSPFVDFRNLTDVLVLQPPQ
jgi:rod shape-determining protein MreC